MGTHGLSPTECVLWGRAEHSLFGSLVPFDSSTTSMCLCARRTGNEVEAGRSPRLGRYVLRVSERQNRYHARPMPYKVASHPGWTVWHAQGLSSRMVRMCQTHLPLCAETRLQVLFEAMYFFGADLAVQAPIVAIDTTCGGTSSVGAARVGGEALRSGFLLFGALFPFVLLSSPPPPPPARPPVHSFPFLCTRSLVRSVARTRVRVCASARAHLPLTFVLARVATHGPNPRNNMQKMPSGCGSGGASTDSCNRYDMWGHQ